MLKTPQQIETRLARMEMEVAKLKACMPKNSSEPWYRQVVGDFGNDKTYREIIRLGRRIRRGKLKG